MNVVGTLSGDKSVLLAAQPAKATAGGTAGAEPLRFLASTEGKRFGCLADPTPGPPQARIVIADQKPAKAYILVVGEGQVAEEIRRKLADELLIADLPASGSPPSDGAMPASHSDVVRLVPPSEAIKAYEEAGGSGIKLIVAVECEQEASALLEKARLTEQPVAMVFVGDKAPAGVDATIAASTAAKDLGATAAEAFAKHISPDAGETGIVFLRDVQRSGDAGPGQDEGGLARGADAGATRFMANLAPATRQCGGGHLPERILTPAPEIEEFASLVHTLDQVLARQELGLEAIKSQIREKYEGLPPEIRLRLFAWLYDDFCLHGYDEHMEETGHYRAIRKVMGYLAPYLRPPLMDVTAGSGVIAEEAIRLMNLSVTLSRLALVMQRPPQIWGDGGGHNEHLPVFEAPFGQPQDQMQVGRDIAELLATRLPQLPDAEAIMRGQIITPDLPLVYANEISPNMRERMHKRLEAYGDNTIVTGYDALQFEPDFAGVCNTVMCSQTFHIIRNQDKYALARQMYQLLAPGGNALVFEEDPFVITPSRHIEGVRLILASIADPLPHRNELIGIFKSVGFRREEERAVSPIDGKHAMRGYVFKKPER